MFSPLPWLPTPATTPEVNMHRAANADADAASASDQFKACRPFAQRAELCCCRKAALAVIDSGCTEVCPTRIVSSRATPSSSSVLGCGRGTVHRLLSAVGSAHRMRGMG